MGSPGPPRGDILRGPALRAEAWASTRRAYLDNLKVVLIAAIIALHGVLGYASIAEVWTYTEFREVTLAMPGQIVLLVLVSPFGFFLIALLFLVAGLLTPSSHAHKGTGRFLADRMLRLGVPFLVYVLVVQPSLVYALAHPLGGKPGSYWDEYLRGGADRRLDTGPLWFVGVLLIFSVGYATWQGWPRRRVPDRSEGRVRPVTVGALGLLVAIVAPTSFVVRVVYPYGGESGFFDLNLWEWPACIAVFVLGLRASGQGWLTAVPTRLAHRSRELSLLALLSMSALLTILGALDVVDDAMGGWHWAAAAFAVIEAALTVFGSVWLLSVAQRRLDKRYRWGPVLARSAYGAFMVQTIFLLGLAVVLRPIGLPAEVKAILVAVGAVACSFTAAWLMITRIPGVSRLL